MFKLAHLTDPHLGPLPAVKLSDLAGKRAFGYLNWITGRNRIHLPEVLKRLMDDVKRQKSDHIAITGDLVNIALAAEFAQATRWLSGVGTSSRVTLVPGNHDAYVAMPKNEGIAEWAPYMRSNPSGAKFETDDAAGFPFVRRFGDVALIGLSSGVPTWPLMASGKLGQTQLQALPDILDGLASADIFRIVLIHHPPLPGQTGWRRALSDADELADVLRRHGAELVLYGHNHRQSVDMFESVSGPVPVVGAPSASSGSRTPWPLARYNCFSISRRGKRWNCQMVGRGLTAPDGKVEKIEHIWLKA